MLDKLLVLVALIVNRANAAGGLSNVKDPRKIWFRWAVPLGGGYDADKPYQTTENEGRTAQNRRKCGVNVAPNTIQKCFYTDCFERLHYGASANNNGWGSRRRAAGAQIHDKVAAHGYGNYAGCGNQNTMTPNSRRRAGGAYGELAIQCQYKECPAEPQVRQFRYWMHGKAAYKGLEANNGKTCPGGTQKWNGATEEITGTSVKPEESWQWYGTQGTRKCIYARPDPPIMTNTTNGMVDSGRKCQCKTVVCRVSVDKEPEKNTGKWGGADGTTSYQKYDECNFMVRIEDVWASPTVPKTWMWNIFSISAFISLSLTGFYYAKYGDKLVTGEGSEGGSDGN